jgi:hypothetical protein
MNQNISVRIAFLISAAVAFPLLAFSYWLGYQHADHPPVVTHISSPPIAGLSQEEVLRMLPTKTWYRHWETKDRSRPATFEVNGDRILGNGTSDKWKLELRWVLNEGDHMYIPIDEHTLRGFHTQSGRQKGMFADKRK